MQTEFNAVYILQVLADIYGRENAVTVSVAAKKKPHRVS